MHFLNLILTQIILFSKLLRIINAIDASIVLNITSPNIREIGTIGIEKEQNEHIELLNDCLAYEFISRSYPIVFEQCYTDIFYKYIFEQPELYIGKNYCTFIKENYTLFTHLIKEKLMIFVNNYHSYFDMHANINFEFACEINTLMPKEFVQENELLDTITNQEMLFYVVLNMSDKIIYEGLDIFFDLMPNKEIVFNSQKLTFQKSNNDHNIDSDRYFIKFYETFLQIDQLIILDINSLIRDAFEFSINVEKEICCEINVTQFILPHLFLLVKEKNISLEAGIKTLDETYGNIKYAVESYCVNHSIYQSSRNNGIKIEIFFEHLKVLHFFKHRYNLKIGKIIKLAKLLEYINKKILEFQNIIAKDNQKSVEIDYNEKEHSRLFSTFSFYNTSIRLLKERIDLFNNYIHPNIEEFIKILYSLSCDIIESKKVNNKLIIPFTSFTDLRKQDLKLHDTFFNKIALLEYDLKRKILQFTELDLDFLKCFYTTLQDVAFLNQIITFNYSFTEPGKYVFLASDCKNNMFLNNVLQFHDIMMKSKSEDVNKNILSNFLEEKKKFKRKTIMQENDENKMPKKKIK